jgi:hypothetical protein
VSARTSPTSTATIPPPRRFDPLDDLPLDGKGANEPVEEGDDDDVRVPRLDHLDRSTEARALRERHPARHVQRLDCVHEREAVSLASGSDTLRLLRRKR